MNEAAFRSLVSGQTTGLAATFKRGALRLASYGYGFGSFIRNQSFDRGLRKPQRAEVPVVSVGNLTTGGTGKTPIVAWVVNWFIERGIPAGIVSRGYRSLDGESNDEKRVLEQLCPSIPHVQNPRRIEAAAEVVRRGARVIVLDDGFQHRQLARDLDIVLIDATNPWGYGHQLPRGLLRESTTGLNRAGLAIVTRADQCVDLPELMHDVRSQTRKSPPVAAVEFRPQRLLQFGGNQDLHRCRGERVIAFCGIGNPVGFRATAKTCGFVVEELMEFPDHHHYSDSDLQSIADTATRRNASVLTTQKDFVKVAKSRWSGPALRAIEIGTTFVAGAENIHAALDRILALVRAKSV